MPDSTETVNFYYDYKSPFTYLALEPVLALERSHRIRLRFIPYAVDIRAAYGGETTQRSERDWFKVRYLYADARRFANERGIVIRGPQKLFESRLALIGGLYAEKHGRFREYSLRVFERFFKRELDIEDASALGAVMTEAGLDPDDFRRDAAADGPAELATQQRQARRGGAVGFPTFIGGVAAAWGPGARHQVSQKLAPDAAQR